MWPTKIKNNNDLINLSSLSTGSDCIRTVLSENDITGDRTTFLEENNQTSNVKNTNLCISSTTCNMSECQVVLNDILSCGQTAKSKALKISREKNHSAPSRQPNDKIYLESVTKKDPIAWPSMKESDKWNQLDDNVFHLLVGASSVHERVALLESSIFTQASLLFGHLPPPKRGLRGLNRRAKYSIKLVLEKNSLLAQIDSCPDETSKAALKDLLAVVRRRLQNFRRGEKNRKKRWKIKKSFQSFTKNPFEAGKRVLDPSCHVTLKCDRATLDLFKSNTLNDPLFNTPLPPLEGLPSAPLPDFNFNNSSLKIEDFSFLLNSRRNGSSPGINGIPYKVYKKCPKIMSFLFKIFKSCAKLSCVPIQWRIASEVYIPKVNPPASDKIQDFRPIALLNVEGKLFFSLISKRMEDHIIKKNKFVDVSIQKGCMEKVPGCWEHMSLVWDELKQAKTDKCNVAAVWLDIANAYGSVPHQLIFTALERYGVHPNWIAIIKSYYSGLWSCSFSPHAPSGWHQHFRGIFTGCTASIILFLAAMNIIIEYVCLGLVMPKSTPSPPIKAFMDDLFLKTNNLQSTQNLLNRTNTALSWARMKLKPSKSKSLIITNGRINQNKQLTITFDNQVLIIPSIVHNPVKFLGRAISFSLKDSDQVEVFSCAVTKGLSLIDKSFHRGVHKVWILQHLLVPRLRWPLLIYEIPVTVVARLEQKISCFIRKWLKLHNSTSNISLYSSVSPCPLPLKSLSAIQKAAKVSGHLLLRDSADDYVSQAHVELKAGNLAVSENVKEAEELLDFKKVLGYHQTNKAGFGSLSIPEVPPKRSHEYRKLVSSLVEEIDQNKVEAKAVQLSLQGQWTKWCNFVRFDLSWKSLLAMPQPLVSFCIGATYDTLPSPSNLHRWNISTEKSCVLCSKSICTTAHILGACKVALIQGRYTFRHDSVLSVIVSAIKNFLSTYTVSSNRKEKISFVKAGTRITKSMKSPVSGLLHLAPDWVILSDLNSSLVVPPFLAITRLRPDILLYSFQYKICIIMELTCCCEENIEEWHRKKFAKYESLSKSISLKGWEVHLFPIEVGARGYCGTSIKSCFSRLGFTGKSVRSLLKSLSLTSIKASFFIWQSRDSKVWNNPSPSHDNPTPSKVSGSSQYGKQKSQEKINQKVHLASVSQLKRPPPLLYNVGIINKGNTCYINSCLQCLSVLPEFWSKLLMGGDNQSPFLAAFLKIMSLLKTSKIPLDPSQFLRFLNQVLIKVGRTNFNLFQQQDACEILSCILNELCGYSVLASDAINIHVRNSVTCNACFSTNVREDLCKILQLPVTSSVQESVDSFLKAEDMHGSNRYFCNSCSSLQPALMEHEFSGIGSCLIIQLKRFVQLGDSVSKDIKSVKCNNQIKIPVVIDSDIISHKNFKLIASINHSGSLERGHYTALINLSSSWFHCNDAAVIKSNQTVPADLCYILFYKAV